MRKSALTFFLISLIALALVLIPDFALAQTNNSLAGRIGDPSGFVYQSWRAILAVVNILVIIALLAISFSNALRLNIDSYQLKKALPKLIIGVLLANASFFIVKFMADISTATLMFIVEESGQSSLAGFIKLAIGRISIETILKVGEFAAPLMGIVVIIFGLIIAIGLVWLALILYVRLAYVYFLAIVSPLALLAYGLPGLEKHFRTWWQDLTKWLFILPAMAGVFWIMIKLGETVEGDRNSVALVQLIIIYVLFFFALGLPKKMGGSIVGDVTNKFKAWTGINAAEKGVKKFGQEKLDYWKLKGNARWGETKMGMKMAEWKAKEQQKIDTLKERQSVSKAKVDLRLTGNKQDRRQIELAGNKQLLQDEIAKKKATAESEVLKESGLYEKLFMSEISKRTAESLKKLVENETRMELSRRAGLKDDDKKKSAQDKLNEKTLKEFYKTQALANVFTEEVGRDEKMALGAQATENLQLVQVAGNHHKLKERIKAMESALKDEKDADRRSLLESQIKEAQEKLKHFKDSFTELVNKENSPYQADKEELEDLKNSEPEYKGLDLIEILGKEMDKPKTSQGRIWAGQQRQSAKSVAAEIEARAEEFKYQTGEEIILEMQEALRSLDKFAEENNKDPQKTKIDSGELKQALMLGDTALLSSKGIKTSDINKFLVAVEKSKNVVQNSGHIFNTQVAKAWLDLHIKHVTESSRTFTTEEQQQILDSLTSTNGAERKWASSTIIQSGVLGGINSGKVQNASIRQDLPIKPARKNNTTSEVDEDEVE